MFNSHDPVAMIQSGVWRAQHLPRDKPRDSVRNITSLVTGTNRYKYFDRPITPPLRQSGESKITDSNLLMTYVLNPEAPCIRTVGTQTDYRESETQTDPWDPLFRVHRVNSDPELLDISELKYGSGLPVNSELVELLVRARERKKWESTLPSLDGDEKDWKKRRIMVVEKENEDWQFKTNKMKEKQNKQLEVMEKHLTEALNEQEQRNFKMLERLHASKIAKSEAWRSKVRSKLNQSIQFMQRKHVAFSKRNNLDVEYTEHEEMKSPQKEMRRKALCDQINAVASSYYLTNPKGMEQLEEWFLEEGNMCMNPEIYLPQKNRRPSRYEKLLDGAHEDILGGKTEKVTVERPQIKLQMDRIVYRPPTPSVPSVPQDELDRHCSALVLQSTFRGRALQKEVLEGTMRNRDLIDELRSVYPAEEEEVPMIEERHKKHLRHYAELKMKDKEAYMCNEAMSKLEGEALSELLNATGKEAARSREVKRIQNIASRAKEERRKREAEEAGRRQQDLIPRDLTIALYKELEKPESSDDEFDLKPDWLKYLQ